VGLLERTRTRGAGEPKDIQTREALTYSFDEKSKWPWPYPARRFKQLIEGPPTQGEQRAVEIKEKKKRGTLRLSGAGARSQVRDGTL